MLIERVGVGHASDEIADDPGAFGGTGRGFGTAPPPSGEIKGAHVVVEELGDYPLAAAHGRHDLLAAVDILEQETLERLLPLRNLGRKEDERCPGPPHIIGRADACPLDGSGAGLDHVLYHQGDEAALHLMSLPPGLDLRPPLQHVADEGANEGHVNEVVKLKQAGAEGIVYIVRIIGDVVGDGGNLGLEAGIGGEQQVGRCGDIVVTGRQSLLRITPGGRAGDVGEGTIVLEDTFELPSSD